AVRQPDRPPALVRPALREPATLLPHPALAAAGTGGWTYPAHCPSAAYRPWRGRPHRPPGAAGGRGRSGQDHRSPTDPAPPSADPTGPSGTSLRTGETP